MVEKMPSERWGQGGNLTSDTHAIRIRKRQAHKQTHKQNLRRVGPPPRLVPHSKTLLLPFFVSTYPDTRCQGSLGNSIFLTMNFFLKMELLINGSGANQI